MDTLDKVMLFVGCLIEVFLLVDYFYNFFSIKERWTMNNVRVITSVICLTIFGINMFESGFLNLIAVPLLWWILVSLIFDAKPGVRLGYLVTAYAVMIGSEFLCVIISEAASSYIAKNGHMITTQYIWQFLFVKFLCYMVFIILKQTSGKSKKRMSNKMCVAYLCLPVCTIGCMITIFYSGINYFGNPVTKLLMTIFWVCMLISNIWIFYVFQRYTESIYKESEHQMEIMHQKAEILRLIQITEMNENYMEMVHNTSHLIKVIREVAAEGKNEDIYKLVTEADESFGANLVKVYSNYKILNTLLTENETKAENCGVKFDAYVEQGTNLDNISDMDLISMVGNLLDNAVTAASKKTEDSLVKIRIFMQNEGSICVVKIVNDYVEKLVKKNGKLQTTKKEEGLHGIGLTSVNRTAEKYNGYLEYYTEMDKFVSVLILPVMEENEERDCDNT